MTLLVSRLSSSVYAAICSSVKKCSSAKNKLALVMLVFSASACSSTGPVSLEVLHQSQHCAVQQAQVKLLAPEEIENTIQKRRGFNLSQGPVLLGSDPGASVEGALVDSNRTQGQQETDSVSHKLADDEQAILVAWGVKPSAGYGISLQQAEANVKQGVLELPVAFVAPPSGMLTAQIITSPCLILKAKLNSDIRTIRAGELSLDVDGVGG